MALEIERFAVTTCFRKRQTAFRNRWRSVKLKKEMMKKRRRRRRMRRKRREGGGGGREEGVISFDIYGVCMIDE